MGCSGTGGHGVVQRLPTPLRLQGTLADRGLGVVRKKEALRRGLGLDRAVDLRRVCGVVEGSNVRRRAQSV